MKKALVVDDSMINLKVAQRMLEGLGLEVTVALSGFECLEKVRGNNYDIIFMDIMMPQMDGKETFKKLKEIDGFNTPVITLTADIEESRDDYINKYGFNEYIAKPIALDELKRILDMFIK